MKREDGEKVERAKRRKVTSGRKQEGRWNKREA